MIILIAVVIVAILLPISFWCYFKLISRVPAYGYWMIGLIVFFLVISPFVPNPLIYGENTAFGQHFCAGISAGLIGLYLTSVYPRISYVEKLFLSLSVASMLGILVELFELLVVESANVNFPLTDTSWDLLADFSGSFLSISIFIIIELLYKIIIKHNPNEK